MLKLFEIDCLSCVNYIVDHSFILFLNVIQIPYVVLTCRCLKFVGFVLRISRTLRIVRPSVCHLQPRCICHDSHYSTFGQMFLQFLLIFKHILRACQKFQLIYRDNVVSLLVILTLQELSGRPIRFHNSNQSSFLFNNR